MSGMSGDEWGMSGMSGMSGQSGGRVGEWVSDLSTTHSAARKAFCFCLFTFAVSPHNRPLFASAVCRPPPIHYIHHLHAPAQSLARKQAGAILEAPTIHWCTTNYYLCIISITFTLHSPCLLMSITHACTPITFSICASAIPRAPYDSPYLVWCFYAITFILLSLHSREIQASL